MLAISVIIPTYNRAYSLARAIESVLQQTNSAEEIIVIDDGSTDNTRELVQSYFPQVSYLWQAQAGVSSARNLGIKHAKSEWIALLDSDDCWLPEKLEKQSAELEKDLNSRFCHTEEIWIRDGVRVNQMNKHKKSGGWIYKNCLPLCAISPSSALIHRSLFDEVGLFDETLPACEDYDLWLRICSQHAVSYVEKPCIEKYGGHDDQLSRKHWGMDRFRITSLIKMLESETLKPDDEDATRVILLKKLAVFIKGGMKRGKDMTDYQLLLEKYS